jgi:hypothetical protein
MPESMFRYHLQSAIDASLSAYNILEEAEWYRWILPARLLC